MTVDFLMLGYDGFYEKVADFVCAPKEGRKARVETSGRRTDGPLVFNAGGAFQFDWSKDRGHSGQLGKSIRCPTATLTSAAA